jgi:hypothetical protein
MQSFERKFASGGVHPCRVGDFAQWAGHSRPSVLVVAKIRLLPKAWHRVVDS